MTTLDPLVGRKPRRDRQIIYLIIACLGVLAFWASQAEIGEVVRGSGRVVPRVQTQLIQNLEGGIVQDIFVTAGDEVDVGHYIVQMNDAEFSSAYQELYEQSLALQIRLLRLEAENAESLDFKVPQDLKETAPATAASEEALFDARMSEFVETRAGMETARELQMEEVALLEPMVERDAVPQVEFIRSRQALTDAERTLASYVGETLSRRSEEYAETLTRLQQIKQQLQSRKGQLDRTRILSPVRGIVNRIYLNTIGGVVNPGEPILEILPYDENLQVEGRITPKDIGFIYVGMPATVKLTAFDFAIYGMLPGEVSHVSADTVTDETERDPQPYYEVTLSLSNQTLSGPDGDVQIRPGMQTTIELQSGTRTVLKYLLKPLFRATDAFSER